jgi:ketosteroid isomerase-like protein
MYTTDAVLLADGSPPIKGREAIQQYWEGALKMGLKDHTFAPITTNQDGKIAYQAATWTLMAPKEGGGGYVQAAGSAVHVFEKQANGKWLIKVHIYNTNSDK